MATPILFLDPAVIFDDARQSFAPDSGWPPPVAPGHSLSAEPINRICSESGARIVLTTKWGLAEPLRGLAARGVIGPFHDDWLAKVMPGGVGLVGAWVQGGEGAPTATPVKIGVTPREAVAQDVIGAWLEKHGEAPHAVVGRPAGRIARVGRIVVDVAPGRDITDANATQIIAALRRAQS